MYNTTSLPGYSPEYLAQSHVRDLLAGTISPFILSSIFVHARLYSRGVLARNWGWDDTLIALCWIGGLIMITLHGLNTNLGVGHHRVLQTPSDRTTQAKFSFIARVIYTLVLCMTKLSICLCYLRIFREVSSKIRNLMYLMIVFITCYTLALVFLAIFQCGPAVSIYWASGFSGPSCLKTQNITIPIAVCNITADLALFALVLPQILPLNIPRNQKIALLVVVSLSFLAIGASLGRIIEAARLFKFSNDMTWDGYRLPIWSSIDVSTSLFCASAFSISPFIRKFFPGFLSPLSSATSRKSSTFTTSSTLTERWKHSISRKLSTLTRHDSHQAMETSWETMNDLELNLGVPMQGGGEPDARVTSFGASRNLTQSRIWSGDGTHTQKTSHIGFSKPIWSGSADNDRNGARAEARDESERSDWVSSIRKTVTLEFAENKKRLQSVGDIKSPV